MPKKNQPVSRRQFMQRSIVASAGVGSTLAAGISGASSPKDADFLTIDPWTNATPKFSKSKLWCSQPL